MAKKEGIIECRYRAISTTKEKYLTFHFRGIIQLIRKMYTIYRVGKCDSCIIHWSRDEYYRVKVPTLSTRK